MTQPGVLPKDCGICGRDPAGSRPFNPRRCKVCADACASLDAHLRLLYAETGRVAGVGVRLTTVKPSGLPMGVFGRCEGVIPVLQARYLRDARPRADEPG